MKKVLATVLFVLILLGTTACTSKNAAENMANADNFVIAVINNCDTEIYGFHHEYFIAQEAIGGGETGAIDGSPSPAGDIMMQEFIADDFPENADLSLLEIEIYVILENDEEVLVGEPIAINAQYGNIYYFSLSGNQSNGFTISAAEKP